MTGHGGDYLNKYGRLEKTVRRRVVLSALIVFMVSACSVRSWAAPIVVEEDQFGELMSELLDLTSDLEESIEKIRNLVDSGGNGSCGGDWVRAGGSPSTPSLTGRGMRRCFPTNTGMAETLLRADLRVSWSVGPKHPVGGAACIGPGSLVGIGRARRARHGVGRDSSQVGHDCTDH